MKFRTAFLPIALVNLSVILWAAEVRKIAPKEAAQLVADGKAVLVDVREASEWQESGVALPAVLLPMSDYKGDQKLWKPFLANNAGKEIILYCRSGTRSESVAADLALKGITAANLGSLKAWTAAGLPTRTVEASSSTK